MKIALSLDDSDIEGFALLFTHSGVKLFEIDHDGLKVTYDSENDNAIFALKMFRQYLPTVPFEQRVALINAVSDRMKLMSVKEDKPNGKKIDIAAA